MQRCNIMYFNEEHCSFVFEQVQDRFRHTPENNANVRRTCSLPLIPEYSRKFGTNLITGIRARCITK